MLTTVPGPVAAQTPDAEAFQARLAADPADVDALLGLALVHVEVGRTANAGALIARARDTVRGRLDRGEGLPTERPDDALLARAEELAQLMRDQPEDARPALELARLYHASGYLSPALDVLTQAADRLGLPPTEPIRIGGDIRPPEKTHDERPRYPKIAQDAGLEGLVVIEAIIDREGRVRDTTLLRSVEQAARTQGLDPAVFPAAAALDDAALEAVRRWRYTPTFLDGQPVEVVMTVTVNFSLR